MWIVGMILIQVYQVFLIFREVCLDTASVDFAGKDQMFRSSSLPCHIRKMVMRSFFMR